MHIVRFERLDRAHLLAKGRGRTSERAAIELRMLMRLAATTLGQPHSSRLSIWAIASDQSPRPLPETNESGTTSRQEAFLLNIVSHQVVALFSGLHGWAALSCCTGKSTEAKTNALQDHRNSSQPQGAKRHTRLVYPRKWRDIACSVYFFGSCNWSCRVIPVSGSFQFSIRVPTASKFTITQIAPSIWMAR